jgi:hypothetical protein
VLKDQIDVKRVENGVKTESMDVQRVCSPAIAGVTAGYFRSSAAHGG